MTLDCNGLQNGQSRVISFCKKTVWRAGGPLFCCPGPVLQQQRDQWDGHQAEQAGEKDALGGKLRVAAVALRQDRGDSGAGHSHDHDDHPHHQGIGDGEKLQQGPGQNREDQKAQNI